MPEPAPPTAAERPSAAPGSAAVMNRSPIRKASYRDGCSRRRSSARPQPALGDRDDAAGNAPGRGRRGRRCDSPSSVRRLRLLTPTTRRRRRRRARPSSSPVMHFDERGQPAVARPDRASPRRSPSSSAATISSTASAPAAAASTIWYSVHDEVLAQQRHGDGRAHLPKMVERCHRRTWARSARKWPPRRPPRSRVRSPPDRSRPQNAARRRAPLALGDDADARCWRARLGTRPRRGAARPAASRSSDARSRAARARRRTSRAAATTASSRSGHGAHDAPQSSSAVAARPLVETRGRAARRRRRAIRRTAGDQQRGAGVEQHDVAPRSALAIRADARPGRRSRPPCRPPDRRRWRARQPDVGRVHVERVDRAVPQLGHLRVAERRQLVEPAGAVDDPGAFGAQGARASAPPARCAPAATRRRAAVARPPGFVSGPSRLNAVRTPSSRRVGPAWRIDGCQCGAIEEREAGLRQRVEHAAGDASRCTPERLEARRRCRARLDTARLPCLATRTPAPASTMRRGRRHVERVRAVAAGPARVEHVADRSTAARTARCAHRLREAHHLRRTLALERQRHEQRGDLRGLERAVHDGAHARRGPARCVRSSWRRSCSSSGANMVTATSRKLRRIWCPTGRQHRLRMELHAEGRVGLVLASPMIVPSPSTRAVTRNPGGTASRAITSE